MKDLLVVLGLVIMAVTVRSKAPAVGQLLTFSNIPNPPAGQERDCKADFAVIVNTGVPDGAAPSCDDNGTYRAIQVYENRKTHVRSATCVTKGGRIILQGPGIQACECPRLRYDGQQRTKQNIIGGYIPQCNDTTGYYTPMQMHGGAGLRWCADTNGNVIGKKMRSQPNC